MFDASGLANSSQAVNYANIKSFADDTQNFLAGCRKQADAETWKQLYERINQIYIQPL